MTFLGHDDKSNTLNLCFLSTHDDVWVDILARADWQALKIGTYML